MRSIGHKLEYGKFQVNVSQKNKKKKNHLNSDQMLEEVPRELVESPVLEILKTWLYESLSDLIYIVPPLSRRLDEVDSGISF